MHVHALKMFSPAMLALLLLAALLAACGSGNGNTGASASAESASPSSAPSQQPSESAAPSASAEAATREYTDAAGRKVEIPTHPQRIVAHYYASEFVSLGIPIVGTNYVNAKLALTDAQLQGIEDIGGEGIVPNVEKVVSLDPDLIVVPDFLEPAELDALSKIAPTVVVGYGADAFTRLRTLAELLGRPELAENWIRNYDEKAAKYREEARPFIQEGETASAFVLYSDKKLYVYNKQRLGPTMYDAFGFAIPPKATALFASEPNTLWKEISLEVLPDYAGDRIFLIGPGDDADAKRALDEVLNGPIWKSLPAVKNGHAYIVGNRWAMNDPLSLDWLLDQMADVLKSAKS